MRVFCRILLRNCHVYLLQKYLPPDEHGTQKCPLQKWLYGVHVRSEEGTTAESAAQAARWHSTRRSKVNRKSVCRSRSCTSSTMMCVAPAYNQEEGRDSFAVITAPSLLKGLLPVCPYCTSTRGNTVSTLLF